MAETTPWTPIDEQAGLWAVERTASSGWHWRSVAVPTAGGGVCVIGPLKGLPEETHAALEEVGEVTALLAPNHFHHLGLPETLARYAGARAFATRTARPRVAKKSGVELADVAELDLADHVSVLEPPGLATGEAIVRVETERGVAWIVGDAFFTVEDKPRGVTGLMLRLTGTAPGLRIGRTFTGLAVRGRAYKEWLLDALERDPPTVLIPAHGAVLGGDDLAERLLEVAHRRL